MTRRAVRTGRAVSIRLLLVAGALVVASGAARLVEALAAESPTAPPTGSARMGASPQTETATPASVPAQVPPPEPPTAFTHVAVIPMDRERVLTDQTVVVRDERIVAMGPAGTVAAPPHAVRVDGRGKFLIPGLADMHAHIPGLAEQFGASESAGERQANAERVLLLFAANGVTTVRLMAGWPEQLELRRRAAARELLSPRIYAASPIIGPGLSPAAAVRIVDEAKATGYDLIKLYGVDGEALDSAAAAARRVGLPIAGHVPGFTTSMLGPERAIQAGYASIEHLTGFSQYLAGGDSSAYSQGGVNGWPVHPVVDEAKLHAIGAALRRAGVWNCPTQMLFELFLWPPDSMAQWPEMRYVAAETVAVWKNDMASTLSVPPAEAGDAIAARRRVIKGLRDAGAGLLLGTDAGVPFLVPGFSVHRELAALMRAGLTPYEALETGTRNVASYFGTLDSTGTVAVGKRADLVLLPDNPLDDIGHTAHPAGVMLAGRWLSRAMLDERLAELEGKVR